MPTWLEIATKYLGTREVPGRESNPVIIGWAKKIGGWVSSFMQQGGDATPWCALFVNICLLEAGIKGTGQSLRARDFEKWGQPLDGPALGAVLVFVRPGGGGHVGFYVGETQDGSLLRVRGGNQSDSVSDAWLSRGRLTAVRWPAGLPLPEPVPVILARDGAPVSMNEG